MSDWSSQDTHPLSLTGPGRNRPEATQGPATTGVRIDVTGLTDGVAALAGRLERLLGELRQRLTD